MGSSGGLPLEVHFLQLGIPTAAWLGILGSGRRRNMFVSTIGTYCSPVNLFSRLELRSCFQRVPYTNVQIRLMPKDKWYLEVEG
jgi:hypothetical protein